MNKIIIFCMMAGCVIGGFFSYGLIKVLPLFGVNHISAEFFIQSYVVSIIIGGALGFWLCLFVKMLIENRKVRK